MSKLGNSTEGADWEGCGEAWLCARPGGLPRAGGGRHRGGQYEQDDDDDDTDEDDVEVDDEEYFQSLPDNTRLMLLHHQDLWSPVGPPYM